MNVVGARRPEMIDSLIFPGARTRVGSLYRYGTYKKATKVR